MTYLKNLSKFWINIFLLTVFSASTFAQSYVKLSPLKWSKVDSLTWDNRDLKKSDITKNAVILIAQRTIYYNTASANTGYTDKSDITHTIIKPLSALGVSAVADGHIYLENDESLVCFQAKVYKPNGEITLYNPTQLPISEYQWDKNYEDKIREVSYSIPNVGKGDIIEIYKTIEYSTCPTLDYLFPDNDFPALKYRFKLIHDDNLSTTIRAYNTTSQITQNQSTTRNEFTIELDEVSVYSNDVYAILPLEVPHILFQAREIGFSTYTQKLVKESWDELLRDVKLQHNYKNTSRKEFGGFKQIMAELTSGNEDLSKLDILEKCIQYFNSTLIVKPLPEDEQNMSSGYYINRGYISINAYRRLNAQMLNYLDIPFGYALARSKYLGPAPFISSAFYPNNFIVINLKGEYHFLFPNSYDSDYYLDEIPINLRGTQAILFELGNLNDTKTLDINSLPYNINKRVSQIVIESPESKPIVKINESLKYELNTYLRSNIQATERSIKKGRNENYIGLDEDSEFISFSTDSHSNLSEFSYRYEYQNSNPIVSNLEEEIYQFDISQFANFIRFPMKVNEERLLTYYGPFKYTDLFNINIKFDHQITLNTEEELFSFSNEIGNMSMHVVSLGNIINIQLNIKLKQNVVSPENYDKLITFDRALSSLKKTAILYSFAND